MIRLRPILQKIYEHLEPQQAIWDLCCDHGLLGEKALQEGLSQEVHFVDQSKPVMIKLKLHLQQVKGANLYHEDAISLPYFLEGNVVIAGVGSHTIIKILDKMRWRGALRILLSTNNKEDLLKAYLVERGWQPYITENTLVKEKNRFRPFFRIDLPIEKKTR